MHKRPGQLCTGARDGVKKFGVGVDRAALDKLASLLRCAAVEAMVGRAVDGILDGATPVRVYERGTWRFAEAVLTIAPPGGCDTPQAKYCT